MRSKNCSRARLSVIDTSASPATLSSGAATPLTEKVSAPWPLDGLLAGIFVAESLQEALQLRSKLAAHESVITRDGLWIGGSWLRVARDQDAQSGVLEREKEINKIEEELKVNKETVAVQESALEVAREELQQAEARREEMQVESNLAHRQFSDARAQFDARRTRLEQIHKRGEALHKEAGEISQQQDEDNQAADASRKRLHEALATLDTLADEREQRMAERDRLRSALEAARSEAQRDRDHAHELELRYQSQHTEQETTAQNLERMRGQQGHLQQRRESLTQSLARQRSAVESHGRGTRREAAKTPCC